MSPHLIFVSAAWGAAGLVFALLILGALSRHRRAARRLAELERPR